jgi:hypothetical protein
MAVMTLTGSIQCINITQQEGITEKFPVWDRDGILEL